MSRAGGAEEGFTLFEVIVILVIVSLSLLIVVPRILPPSKARIEALAGDVSRELLRARDIAVSSASIVRVEPDSITGRLSMRRVQLEGDTIAFFPDGSSSGGSVLVALGGAQARVVVADLTGRPSIVPP